MGATMGEVDALVKTSEDQVGPAAPADRADETRAAAAPAWTAAAESVERFILTVLDGPSAGLSRSSAGGRCSIGSHPLNQLVIDDPTVSRFHCEIRVDPSAGARVVDLRSKNGTLVDGVRICEAFLRAGSRLQLGSATVRFDSATERDPLPPAPATRFGSLVGTSRAMRDAIAVLERAAPSEATILLEGETGTGKGRAAEAIHRAGARRDGPFVVVDCGAIPANLLETELFGHEKGAFTGAEARRVGAFEEASGGTLFLDEIGEMASDLQPKLLRAIENREIRRVGSNRYQPVNLRFVAATNRDLRAEVNAGRFRSDLYYRLAVVRVTLPPLRERPEDLPALVGALLEQLGVAPAAAASLLQPDFLDELRRAGWPGNVRELRNHLEARLVLAPPDPRPAASQAETTAYVEARRAALAAFERQYLDELMRRFPGKVAQAAHAAGIDRVYLYRLLKRQGMRSS